MANRAQVKKALESHEDKLCQIENVVGLGIVSADENSDDSPDLAIAVYVKEPFEKLTPKEKDQKSRSAKKPKPAAKAGKKELQVHSSESDEPLPKFLKVLYRKEEIKVPIRIIVQGAVELESTEKGIGKEVLGKEPLGKESLGKSTLGKEPIE